MRRRRTRLFLPTAFVAAYLALGWLIYHQLTGSPNTEALARGEPAATPSPGELPPELRFTMANIEDFNSILERPLFSPNRRPPVVEGGAATATNGDFGYDLKGVLIDDEARIALFWKTDGSGDVRQAEGTTIDGWLLKEVASDFVVLERDGDELVLELAFQSPPTRTNAEK
jgi:type II secretory pathway component PulC